MRSMQPFLFRVIFVITFLGLWHSPVHSQDLIANINQNTGDSGIEAIHAGTSNAAVLVNFEGDSITWFLYDSVTQEITSLISFSHSNYNSLVLGSLVHNDVLYFFLRKFPNLSLFAISLETAEIVGLHEFQANSTIGSVDIVVSDDSIFFFVWEEGAYHFCKADGFLNSVQRLFELESYSPVGLYKYGEDFVLHARDQNVHSLIKLSKNGGSEIFFNTSLFLQTGNASQIYIFNNEVFFVAALSDEINTRIIWRSSGTELGTVPVTDSSHGNVLYAVEHENQLLFVSEDSMDLQKLWSFDPGSDELNMVYDLGSNQEELFAIHSGTKGLLFEAHDLIRNRFYFLSNDNTIPTEILEPGFFSLLLPFDRHFINQDDIVYFSFPHPDLGIELWKTDGSPGGTTMVAEIFEGPGHSDIDHLTSLGKEILFTARHPDYGFELWRTDGSDMGTELVVDLTQDDQGSYPYTYNVSLGNKLFFTAVTAEFGDEPYITDGTPEGTKLLNDIYRGPRGSNACCFTQLGDKVFFVARSDTLSKTVYETDGSTDGTKPLFDIPVLNGMIKFRDHLLFDGWTPENGLELWKTDGTPANTEMVKDIFEGSEWSWPQFPFFNQKLDSVAYFIANDGIHDNEIWKTDGTDAGTKRITNIALSDLAPLDPYPMRLLEFQNDLIFPVFTEEFGRDLWKYVENEDTTILIIDFPPALNEPRFHNLLTIGDKFIFSVSQSHEGIYCSDGTVENSDTVFAGGVGQLVRFKDNFIFNGDGELWKTDGTEEGTELILDIVPGDNGSDPSDFLVYEDIIIFTATTPANGREIWKTDGTAEGTSLLVDLDLGPNSSDPRYYNVIQDRMVFSAYTPLVNRELFGLKNICLQPLERILNDQPLISDVIKAEVRIESKSPIMEGQMISFHAGQEVILDRGFIIDEGAQFEIEMEQCVED